MATEEQKSWFSKAFAEGKDIFNKVEETVEDAASSVVETVETAAEEVVEGAKRIAGQEEPAAAPPGQPAGAAPPASSGPISIGDSVGKGGKNKPEDVRAVQAALGLPVTGNSDSKTVDAIIALQKSLGQAKPDGRIDPGGPTLRALAGKVGGAAKAPPAAAVAPKTAGKACPVADIIVETQNKAGSVDPALAKARDDFKKLVLAEPGKPTFKVTSEFRSIDYQKHFYSLRTTFIELNKLEGIESYVAAKRPQLRITKDSPYASCQGLVDKVNEEIRKHTLVAGKPDNAPSVSNPDNPNNAHHTQGEAFDASIGGITQDKIDELAKKAGLHRPYVNTDPIHYELI